MRIRNTFVQLALLALALSASQSRAQTIPDTTLAFPTRWDAQVGAAVDFTQGPITVLHVTAEPMARVRADRHRVELAGSQGFGVSDGDRFVRDLRALLRYRVSVLSYERRWLPDLSVVALGFFERSEPQRHEWLTNTGAGADVTVVGTDGARLSLTAGYVFEREVFSKLTREDVPTRMVRDSQLAIWAHRAVFGLELGFEPTPWLHFGERAFAFMPLGHCVCDTKIENSLFVRLMAQGSPLTFQLEAAGLYDPRPALRATQLRTLARTSLVLHFR